MTKQILIGSIGLLVITAAAVIYHFLPSKNIIIHNSKPLKKFTLNVIASEAKQSHEIATAPMGPRNDFLRGLNSTTTNHGNLFPEQKFLLHGPVDINKASIEELEAIPHIGPSLARRIYDYINQNDRISNINELLEIKGVGPNNIKRIAKYIYIAKPEK